MRAILMSEKPSSIEKIANGEKEIIAKTNKPSLDIPFKVYLHCTYGQGLINQGFGNRLIDENVSSKKGYGNMLNGKVVGYFICDKIDTHCYTDLSCPNPSYEGDDSMVNCGDGYWLSDNDCEPTCLIYNELIDYGKGKDLYFWHITDLVIYDEPKELSEFRYPEPKQCCHAIYGETCWGGFYDAKCNHIDFYKCANRITKAPNSWQYVEEKQL